MEIGEEEDFIQPVLIMYIKEIFSFSEVRGDIYWYPFFTIDRPTYKNNKLPDRLHLTPRLK